jgi:hypothetical protein
MSTQNQRRCSGCNNTGHNIRTCIKQMELAILNEYSRRSLVNIPNAFPEALIPSTNHINQLCAKYGLSIIHLNNEQKLERLHRIYLQLGSQHRRNLINSEYIQVQQRIQRRQQRPNIYRPSYLPPVSPQVEIEEQEQILYDIHAMNDIVYQMVQLRQLTKRKPSLQIILDKTKFQHNNDIGDCPICYENCTSMITTDCNHSYCQPCISKLINTVNKTKLPCPLCRENVKNIFVFSESSSDKMLQL